MTLKDATTKRAVSTTSSPRTEEPTLTQTQNTYNGANAKGEIQLSTTIHYGDQKETDIESEREVIDVIYKETRI